MAIPEAVSTSSAGTGRRRIGVPEIVFFVVAASAPMTVAAGGLPTSFAVTGVVGIPLLYVVLAVLLAVFTGGYAAMSRSIANAGAFYAYVTHGLGRVAGVGAAFVALVSYNTMQIGLYGLFGFTTADFLDAKLGIDLPWWVVALAGARTRRPAARSRHGDGTPPLPERWAPPSPSPWPASWDSRRRPSTARNAATRAGRSAAPPISPSS